MSNHIHHAINYIEFTVNDLVKAKLFYQSVFGWQFNDYGPGYAGIRGNDGEVGGLRFDPTVNTGGRRFHFTDPSGNELAVWSEK